MFWGGETSILYVCLHVLKMFEFPCPRQFLVVSSFSKWAYWIIENMIERFHSNGSKKEEKHQTIDIVLYDAKQLSSCVRSMYLNVMLVTWIQWLIIRVEVLGMATWIRIFSLSVFGLFFETHTLTHSITHTNNNLANFYWFIFFHIFFHWLCPSLLMYEQAVPYGKCGGILEIAEFREKTNQSKTDENEERKREEDGKFWKWDARKCYAIFCHQIEWITFSMNELKFVETHSEKHRDPWWSINTETKI